LVDNLIWEPREFGHAPILAPNGCQSKKIPCEAG
jgi:hypothetical protein